MTATASEGPFVVTDDTTRPEIEEALHNASKTAGRIPRHFTERKESVHTYINYLLYAWQMRP